MPKWVSEEYITKFKENVAIRSSCKTFLWPSNGQWLYFFGKRDLINSIVSDSTFVQFKVKNDAFLITATKNGLFESPIEITLSAVWSQWSPNQTTQNVTEIN